MTPDGLSNRRYFNERVLRSTADAPSAAASCWRISITSNASTDTWAPGRAMRWLAAMSQRLSARCANRQARPMGGEEFLAVLAR